MEEADTEVSLGYFRGPLDSVLAALECAELPETAYLELDGEAVELHDLAEELTADDPQLSERNRLARNGSWQFGPIKFGGGPLVIPLRAHVLARLRDMLQRHADPEIASNLRVFDSVGMLLDAPDVGDNDIWVGRRLSNESIMAIRRTLAGGLASEQS